MKHLIISHSFIKILDIKGLAIRIFLHRVQYRIHDGTRCVWVINVFLHFQNSHAGIVVLKFVYQDPNLFRIQQIHVGLAPRSSDPVILLTSRRFVISENLSEFLSRQRFCFLPLSPAFHNFHLSFFVVELRSFVFDLFGQGLELLAFLLSAF